MPVGIYKEQLLALKHTHTHTHTHTHIFHLAILVGG